VQENRHRRSLVESGGPKVLDVADESAKVFRTSHPSLDEGSFKPIEVARH